MEIYKPLSNGKCTLLRGELYARYVLDRNYILSLENDALLLNFYQEAGLMSDSMPFSNIPENLLTGWESPTCQLRGHFVGHLLSACALAYHNMNDLELLGKGNQIVKELRRCQLEHGDGWLFSIPEKYLDWIARGKRIWAPHYTVHKMLMGLVDMAKYAQSELALTVLNDAADWFYNWTGQFTREQLDDILDTETGAMMEAFADLYGLTGNPRHKELMERYYRGRLFGPLLNGQDVLSNMHANTTIPETHGCMRAYEVTGEERYLDTVMAYWDMAVTQRGYFATGGQTCYEVWTSPHAFRDRLNEDNQEHCVVYNMIRLAEFLFRHTGDHIYQDYIERNYQNGILAQQHDETGMVAYYLPMNAGGKAKWGNERHNFWCCHGTLVQAHMRHNEGVCYESPDGLAVMQYRAAQVDTELNGAPVKLVISEKADTPLSYYSPNAESVAAHITPYRGRRYGIEVHADNVEFVLRLRVPWWVDGEAEVFLNGEPAGKRKPGTIFGIKGVWLDDKIELRFPTRLTACPLDDAPDVVAFMDGPDVLVGLTDDDTLFYDGDLSRAADALEPENRKNFLQFKRAYHTVNQPRNVRFIQLKDLRDETYTMYFRLQRR